MSTSLRLDLLPEIRRSSNTVYRIAFRSCQRTLQVEKNPSEPPPASHWAPEKCDYFAGGEDMSQARSDSSDVHRRAGAQQRGKELDPVAHLC